MVDYAGAISLSQPHSSEEDNSEHTPHSLPVSLSGAEFGSSSQAKPLQPKPRGRPPGSKNKPKPPIVITKENESALKPVVIEISAGSDVVETLIHFARRRHVGLTILSGTGSVSNVTLRHPMSHATSLSLHGPFSLVSLSGSFLVSDTASSSKLTASSSFGICLAGAQGQVFGGIVGGKVTAASLVVVVAATFVDPVFHLLPCEGEDDAVLEGVKPVNVNSDESASPMPVCAYSAAPISCQTPPDAVPWGPNSRPSY